MHWKWFPPIIAAVVAAAAWITFAAGLALGFERPVMFVIAIVGAFGLEAVTWSLAAALGITVFQARTRIIGGLTSLYRRYAG